MKVFIIRLIKKMIINQEDKKKDEKDPGDIETNLIDQGAHKNLLRLIA